MSILIVGEKPSVSRAISAVVGASSAHKGYTEGNGYVVSWCVGHLVGLKFPNEYGNGWDQRGSFSQLPMLPEKWQFRVTDSTKAQYELLKKLIGAGGAGLFHARGADGPQGRGCGESAVGGDHPPGPEKNGEVMGNLHGLFYSVGAIAGITAAALCAVLVMWTLRDARRGAMRAVTIALMVCLAVMAACILGMNLTA